MPGKWLPTFDLGLVSMVMKTDMKHVCSRVLIVLVMVAMACTMDEGTKDDFLIFSSAFDFNESDHGWKHGFSDYPAGPDDSVFFELQYAYTEEPSNLNSGRKAIMLSGNNHSDDLFMFIKKKITGLKSRTNYTLTFDVDFICNAKAGYVGIGGAPGESVFLKVGASKIEPKSVIENGSFVMNIDKGNQSESGEDMIKIGNIASPSETDYSRLTLSNSSAAKDRFVTTTNAAGELWLIVGTDSGYEGVTTMYYSKINVVFSASK